MARKKERSTSNSNRMVAFDWNRIHDARCLSKTNNFESSYLWPFAIGIARETRESWSLFTADLFFVHQY